MKLFFSGDVPFYLQKQSDDLIMSVDLLGCTYVPGELTRVVNEGIIKLYRVSQIKDDPPLARLTVVLNTASDYAFEKDGTGIRVLFSGKKNQLTPAETVKAELIPETYEKKSSADRLITLSFNERPFSEIVYALAKEFGLNVMFEKKCEFPVTVELRAASLADCLRDLFDANRVEYRLEKNMLKVTGRLETPLFDKKVSFNFNGMKLREAVQTISMITGLNIVVDEQVKERDVNLFISEMKLLDMMELLLTTYQLDGYRFNENTFIVSEKYQGKKYVKDKIRRVFQLVNAAPDDVITILKGNQELSSRLSLDSITVDKRIDSLIVYDTPDNIEILTDIIKGIDKKLRQVRIDVRLVEINKNELDRMGVSLQNLPMTYKIKSIGEYENISGSLVASLEMLTQNKKARILSSPIIRVIDGKTATINVGEVVPVPYYSYEGLNINAGSYINPQGGQSQQYNLTSEQLQYLQPLKKYKDMDVGIKLTVKPSIHEDREIELDVRLDITSIVSIDDDGQVHSTTKNTETFVRVKDGETVVLGGLISENEKKDVDSYPIVDRVPILKKLFTRRNNQTLNSEMVMFLTPYLVNEDKPEPQMANIEDRAYSGRN